MFSQGGSIRFAPWNTLECIKGSQFSTWKPPSRDCPHTEIDRRTIGSAEIPYDGFMIASFGVCGAELLADIVEKTTRRFLDYWTCHSQGLVREEKYALGVARDEWYNSFSSLYFSNSTGGSATAKNRND